MTKYFLIIFGESDSFIRPCVKLKFSFRQFLIYSGSPWKQGNLVYDAAANVTSALTHAKSTLRGKHPSGPLYFRPALLYQEQSSKEKPEKQPKEQK